MQKVRRRVPSDLLRQLATLPPVARLLLSNAVVIATVLALGLHALLATLLRRPRGVAGDG